MNVQLELELLDTARNGSGIANLDNVHLLAIHLIHQRMLDVSELLNVSFVLVDARENVLFTTPQSHMQGDRCRRD